MLNAAGLGAIVLLGCAGRPLPEDATDADKLAKIQAMFAEYQEDFPDARNVTVDEFLAMRESDAEVVLVDARTEKERKISIIPGAVSREHFDANREAYADHRVVSYCTIGYRSGKYTESLRDEGLDAYNLAGSILAWTHAGQPLVTPDGESTQRVHTYGAQWDLVADGYEAVN